MPLPPESIHDDELISYLLGALPDEKSERLDELALVDDELAARLRLVEDELLDAYATGTMSGDRLERFEAFYLMSPMRREKAEFAKRFLAAIDAPAAPSTAAAAGTSAPRGWLPVSLAAAAMLVVASGALLLEDIRLRRDLGHAERKVAAADERARALSGQLEQQEQSAVAARQALAAERVAPPPAAIALVLLPQTRGVDPVPIIAVDPETRTVPLDLRIETDGLTPYEAALRDPATNGVVWRSAALTAQHVRRPPVVPVVVPAALLKSQHYALDLFGRAPGRAPEFAGSYAFEVVRH